MEATTNYADTIVNEMGETQGQLKTIFETIQPTNWKDTIVCTVARECVGATVRAIEFFVGGTTYATQNGEMFTLRNAGYYANIGA